MGGLWSGAEVHAIAPDSGSAFAAATRGTVDTDGFLDRRRPMANLITLARTLLAFVVVAMLHVRTKEIYLAAAGLTLALIAMDTLDGYVARKRRECTKFGAVVDILGDRVVEMTYWIVFVKF